MKMFVAWKDNLMGIVAVKEGKASLDVKTYPSGEYPEKFLLKLLSSCEEEVEALYGSEPPFGVSDFLSNGRKVPLVPIPPTENPAEFFLTYRLAAMENPEFLLRLEDKEIGDAAQVNVNDDAVTLETLTCSCFSRQVPCKHVVIVVNSLPTSIFQEILRKKVSRVLGMDVTLETPLREERKDKAVPSIRASLWDCKHLGCYLEKRRPRLEEWESKVRGLEFFNIDGVASFPSGSIVFVEWKVRKEIPYPQVVLFKQLTALSDRIVVFVCVGDPQAAEVDAVKVFYKGGMTDWQKVSTEELLQAISTFGKEGLLPEWRERL